jgi:RHH-type transcriptional regulator, rel operon repressor / antitoxin RelB
MELQVNISDELAEWLDTEAAAAGETPEQLTRAALIRYLEDREDLRLAEEGLRSAREEGTITMEELKRNLGLDA